MDDTIIINHTSFDVSLTYPCHHVIAFLQVYTSNSMRFAILALHWKVYCLTQHHFETAVSQSFRKFFPKFSIDPDPLQFFHIFESPLNITGADEAQGEAPGGHGTHGPRGGLGAAPGGHRGVAPRRIFPEVDTTYFSISNINIFSVHYCTNHTTILRCNLTYKINNDHNCDITDIIPLFDSYSIL